MKARSAPKLELVAVARTNNIDLAAARELGVGVCNVRGYCTSSVVQHVCRSRRGTMTRCSIQEYRICS